MRPSTPRHPLAEAGLTKTISGGRITAPRSSSGSVRRIYSQRGPYVNNPSPSPEKSASRHSWPKGRTVTGQKIVTHATKQFAKKCFSPTGPYINNPSAKARRPDAKPRNQPLYQARHLSMSKAAAQARSMGIQGAGFQTITARFITRRKNDVYWGKVRKKGDVAFKGDITGRKIRTLDHRSPKIGLVGTDTLPFARRSPRQIKRRASQQLGGYQVQRAPAIIWKGDIAGAPVRRRTLAAHQKNRKVCLAPQVEHLSQRQRCWWFHSCTPKAATRPSPKVELNLYPAKALALAPLHL